MRDDFLAMASHDMRTPLAVILANLQFARRRLVGIEAEHAEVIKNLDAAERTTHKLTGLVGELMDISILRSGQALPLNRGRSTSRRSRRARPMSIGASARNMRSRPGSRKASSVTGTRPASSECCGTCWTTR